MDAILFYVFAAIAVASALVVVGQRNPMYSAFALIVTLCSMSVIFALLGSPFIAVLQVIVYAGAIMVLFLFVVMLLNAPREEALVRATIPLALGGRPLRVGVVLGTIFFVEIAWALSRVGDRAMGGDAATAAHVQSVRQVGIELFTTHAFAFEVTSVLILVAMVGAVALAKRNL